MQLELDTRSLNAAKPRDLMADALEWIDKNPMAWLFVADRAHFAAKYRGGVRIKGYIEELRIDPKVLAVAILIKLPNAYSAPFGRILAAWYPELAPWIPLQHSKVDGLCIPPRPDWCR